MLGLKILKINHKTELKFHKSTDLLVWFYLKKYNFWNYYLWFWYYHRFNSHSKLDLKYADTYVSDLVSALNSSSATFKGHHPPWYETNTHKISSFMIFLLQTSVKVTIIIIETSPFWAVDYTYSCIQKRTNHSTFVNDSARTKQSTSLYQYHYTKFHSQATRIRRHTCWFYEGDSASDNNRNMQICGQKCLNKITCINVEKCNF